MVQRISQFERIISPATDPAKKRLGGDPTRILLCDHKMQVNLLLWIFACIGNLFQVVTIGLKKLFSEVFSITNLRAKFFLEPWEKRGAHIF